MKCSNKFIFYFVLLTLKHIFTLCVCINTHTHTHTHTQRERDKYVLVLFLNNKSAKISPAAQLSVFLFPSFSCRPSLTVPFIFCNVFDNLKWLWESKCVCHNTSLSYLYLWLKVNSWWALRYQRLHDQSFSNKQPTVFWKPGLFIAHGLYLLLNWDYAKRDVGRANICSRIVIL